MLRLLNFLSKQHKQNTRYNHLYPDRKFFKIFSKKLLTIMTPYNIICLALNDITKNNEVWLSLVERCVRDAEVAGSNPVTSTNDEGTP